MRPKLKEESQEIDKMSIPVLNYYQDAEAHIDELEERDKKIVSIIEGEDLLNGDPLVLGSLLATIKQVLKKALK